MAIMYPTDIENYNYTSSEKYMYEEFTRQLSDKYHVFYSVRWFETEGGKRIDSESDFIVFDPSFGYITIEVKGGKDIIQNGNEWYLLETQDGEESKRKLKCSPYIQAEKSMRHFFNYFQEAFHQSFNGTYGFAAAFPWYSSERIIGSGSPREATIDMTDMDNLQQKVNAIFHYWKNRRNLTIPFSASQRQRFISLINKRISLSAAAGALIPIREKELNKINAIQNSILDAVYHYHELRFVGGAGTGKTYIGAKKAIYEAEAGKKVLFTSCSANLTEYVRHEIFRDSAKITCLHFDGLMHKLFTESYGELVALRNGFFDAVGAIPDSEKYDCIIVDEAQDYDLDMGLTIRALLKPNFSFFYVFFDENQNVFSKDFENSFAIAYPPIILRYNIRNTGKIYENAANRTGLGKETTANSLLGIEPEYYDYKNSRQCIKALTNIVNRLTQKEYVSPTSMVILSNRPFENSVLKDERQVGQFVIDRAEKKSIISNSTIRFRTVKEFKGMEADVVIYLNHTSKGEILSVEQLCESYVALTRPRYYLYVLNVSA